jgi:hypothetical protein
MSLRNVKHKIYPLDEDHNDMDFNRNEHQVHYPQNIDTEQQQEEKDERSLDNEVRKDAFHSEATLRLSNLTNFSQDEEWPALMDDQAAIDAHHLCRLSSTESEIRNQVIQSRKITIRSITWNQHAQPFPSMELVQKCLLPHGYYHVIAIGTQECENSISKSILYPSKENWERLCRDALGTDYEFIRGHSLQASHL